MKSLCASSVSASNTQTKTPIPRLESAFQKQQTGHTVSSPGDARKSLRSMRCSVNIKVTLNTLMAYTPDGLGWATFEMQPHHDPGDSVRHETRGTKLPLVQHHSRYEHNKL